MHLAIRTEVREVNGGRYMKDASTTRVVVIKNGVAKELHNLPETIVAELEEAYDKAPIRGLSRDTYSALVEFFGKKLVAYKQELANTQADEELEMFKRTVAFARAFEIYDEESPKFLDMLLTVERSVENLPDFDSKVISMKNLKNLIGVDWKDANKDFRAWARKLFEESGLKIGIVRMSKFYYGVITQLSAA